jgi:hypothetical protein
MSIRRLFGVAAVVIGLAAAPVPGAFSQVPVCEWAGTPCKLSVGLDNAMVIDPVVAPNGQRVVLIHKDEETLRVELYSARLTGGGPPLRLSAAGEHSNFVAISPDSARVLYTVRAGTGQPGDPLRNELYSVPIAGPVSARVRLAADVSTAVRVRVSPDSAKVVFAPPQRDRLRVVPIAGPTSAGERLTDPFVAGGKVSETRTSANSRSVVYRADQITVGVNELYRVPLTLSPEPDPPTTRLSGPLAAGGDVDEFTLASDNIRAVYRADQDTDEVHELYSVRLGGAGRVKVNRTMPPLWDVQAPNQEVGEEDDAPARILPDGSRVVYEIGRVNDNGRVFGELYSVPIAGPGNASVRLDHPPLIPPSPIPFRQIFALDYKIGADSSRVVYTMVDQRLPGEPNSPNVLLASVPATGPASTGQKLAGPTDSGYLYELSPDSGRVAYITLGAQNNIFSVPIAGGTSLRLNGTETLEGGFLRINATNTRAVYDARTLFGTPALFSVPLDGNGPRYNLTNSLTGTWYLRGYGLTPGSGTVVYTIQRGDLDAPVEAFSSRLTPVILPPIP